MYAKNNFNWGCPMLGNNAALRNHRVSIKKPSVKCEINTTTCGHRHHRNSSVSSADCHCYWSLIKT